MVALGTASAGCEQTPASPSNNAPFSLVDVRVGSGATAAASGHTLAVHYTGWLYDASRPGQRGAQFDSSVGSTPFTFSLGFGEVIQGWDRGLEGMREGGIRRLVIPPSLGYGVSRNNSIPPNATLLFEVELLDLVGVDDAAAQ